MKSNEDNREASGQHKRNSSTLSRTNDIQNGTRISALLNIGKLCSILKKILGTNFGNEYSNSSQRGIKN